MLMGRRIKVTAEPFERNEASGRAMAYRLTPSGDLKGRILFAHATGNDSLFPQVELFQAWLKAGYEVFTFDIDGHGRHSSTLLSFNSCLSMIQAAVAQAITGSAVLPLHGAGHSLGAALWLRGLAETSLALTSLVLLSAPLRIELGYKAFFSEFHAIHTGDFWRQRHYYGALGIIPPMGPWRRETYPIRFRNDMTPEETHPQQRRASSLNYPHRIAALVEQLEIESSAINVRVPTLLINGSHDQIVPAAQGARLSAVMPHASCCQVAGATHYTVPFAEDTLRMSLEHFQHSS